MLDERKGEKSKDSQICILEEVYLSEIDLSFEVCILFSVAQYLGWFNTESFDKAVKKVVKCLSVITRAERWYYYIFHWDSISYEMPGKS